MKSPQEIIEYIVHSGEKKAHYSCIKELCLGFYAGAYIGFGSLLAFVVGGGMPNMDAGLSTFFFAAVFPVGIIMIIFTNTELFTSNCLYMTVALLERKVSPKQAAKVLCLSWIGNLIGCLFVAYLLAYIPETLHSGAPHEKLMHVTDHKIDGNVGTRILKAIGANWLVNVGIWMCCAGKDAVAKMFGLWWPIMTFVALGYEHSVANMFFLSIGLMEGNDHAVWEMIFKNLIPATFGNYVGAALFIGLLPWIFFYRNTSSKTIDKESELSNVAVSSPTESKN
eukprot:GCRY01000230.1.p1 GENE.GCRY01000230.1~~GCRY01000230.1.p1  ORF type:complete len:281 (+),score=20.11 GCRY01000230.1:127-969(+)